MARNDQHSAPELSPPVADREESRRRADEWRAAMFDLMARLPMDEVKRAWDGHRQEVERRRLMARRRKAARRRARRWLLPRLSAFTTTAEVLAGLLRVGRLAGVATIRFYSCYPDADTLVSVDSTGHQPDEEMLLRLGTVVRKREACPPDRSDAFVCIAARRPVLFTLDPTLDRPLAVDTAGPTDRRLLRVRQREWQTGEVLPQACRQRVEIPLVHMGEVVGKLSCGLAERPTPPSAGRVAWFCKMADRAGAVLHAMQMAYSVTVRCTLDRSRDGIITTRTLPEFFDYCAIKMPALLGASRASIFTVSEDELKSRRLILRRTSYQDSRPLEDGGTDDRGRTGYYQLDNPYASITAFAAMRRQPIRLQGLKRGDPLFEAQLRLIDPQLRWSNTIQDSQSHESLLVVPVVWKEELLGLVRFTEKAGIGRDRYFSQTDERHLTRLAADFLAPHLRTLLDREADRRFCELVQDEQIAEGLAQAFVGADAGARRKDQAAALEGVMTTLIGSTGRRLYLANRERVDRPGRITSVLAGNLSRTPVGGPSKRRRTAAEEEKLSDWPLTRLVLEKGRCMYFHDVTKAVDDGLLRKLSPDTACALACPIRLGPAERGVLLLQSARHDLIPEVIVPLLTRFAEQTPRAVARLLAQ